MQAADFVDSKTLLRNPRCNLKMSYSDFLSNMFFVGRFGECITTHPSAWRSYLGTDEFATEHAADHQWEISYRPPVS